MRLPSILSRYISKNFFLAFLGSLFVLVALILLFDVIDLLRRASSEESMTFGDVVSLGFLKLPQMVPIILPFSILIASLITFYRLSKSNELVIARSAGLSVWNFLMPVFVVSLLIGIFNVTIFNPFSATMRKKYDVLEGLKFENQSGFSWSSKGLWLREKKGDNPIVIHADAVHQRDRELYLKDVSVLVLNPDETLSVQVESSAGLLTGHTLTVAEGVLFSEEGQKKKSSAFSLPTELNLEKIMQTFEEPEEISFWQLPSFIDLLDRSGFSSIRHKMHFYALLSSPLNLLAMVFIAAMFALSPNQRQGGILMKVSGAVLFGFLLFFISKLTAALGTSGGLPVVLATFGPSIVMIFVAVSVLLHLEDG